MKIDGPLLTRALRVSVAAATLTALTACPDADGDGWEDSEDCAPDDASIHPSAPEVCDAADNDCDGFVDNAAVDESTFFGDGDADGFGDPSVSTTACSAPAGYVVDSTDCDDQDALRRPAPPVDPGFVLDRCGQGTVVDDMTVVGGGGGWAVVDVFPAGLSTASLSTTPGCSGDALELTWSLAPATPGIGSWVVGRRVLPAPVALNPGHVMVSPVAAAAGSPPSFRVELKLEDAAGCRTTVHFDELTALPVWRSSLVPLRLFSEPPDPSTSTCGAAGTDLTSVIALELAISDPVGNGAGVLRFDDLTVVAPADLSLPAPTFFECPPPDVAGPLGDLRSRIAGDFQVRTAASPHGFFATWYPELPVRYYVYAEALALIVLSREAARTSDPLMAAAATAIADRFVALQSVDGSWVDYYLDDVVPGDLVAGTAASWEGNVAWSTIGLATYVALVSPASPGPYDAAVQRGADWLEGRVSAFAPLGYSPGGLTYGTEGNVSSYFAFVAAGRTVSADAMAGFLLAEAWSTAEERFWMGVGDAGYALDVVANWGGAFLRHRGMDPSALAGAALGGGLFAVESFDGSTVGLGDIWGPWAPAVEFQAQYCALGGPGSGYLAPDLLALEGPDGVFPGSTDDFGGGPGWLTSWTGQTPSAWVYLCLDGGLLTGL